VSEDCSRAAGRVAIGVHSVRVGRLRDTIERRDGGIASRLFTASELDAARRGNRVRWPSLAGRLAAKGAARRLLAERGHQADWREIEVVRGDRGQPLLLLHGDAQRAAEDCGFEALQVSISHEAGMAVAVVLTWRRG
jgi:holo-[acyl-carrier protein] synthase